MSNKPIFKTNKQPFNIKKGPVLLENSLRTKEPVSVVENITPQFEGIFVTIRMEYCSPKRGKLEHEFSFFAPEGITQAALDRLFFSIQQRGSLIAPFYGLPQIAPVDHPEQTNESAHPYSEITSLRLTGHYQASGELIDIQELLPFDEPYKALIKNEPTKAFIKMRRQYLNERALLLIEDLTDALNELGEDVAAVKGVSEHIKSTLQ
jgi:hypothetical protein